MHRKVPPKNEDLQQPEVEKTEENKGFHLLPLRLLVLEKRKMASPIVGKKKKKTCVLGDSFLATEWKLSGWRQTWTLHAWIPEWMQYMAFRVAYLIFESLLCLECTSWSEGASLADNDLAWLQRKCAESDPLNSSHSIKEDLSHQPSSQMHCFFFITFHSFLSHLLVLHPSESYSATFSPH